MAEELTWDYTGDESSPLLQRAASPMYSGERNVLNRRQARYVLYNVTEVARVLRTGLTREHVHDIPVTHNGIGDDQTPRGKLALCCRKLSDASARYARYIPIILAFAVVIAIVVETVWDAVNTSATHRPYVASVLCGISVLFLIGVYTSLVNRAVDFHITIGAVIVSFLCSVTVFALIYVVCYRFDKSSLLLSRQSVSHDEIFIATYCRLLDFSVSVFTLCSTGRIDASVWYTQLILSLQMVTAYCHFMLGVATLMIYLHVVSPLAASANTEPTTVRQTATRYDADNESIGPFDMHMLSSSNRDDSMATSRPMPSPRQLSNSNVGMIMNAEDVYQHSI